MSTPVPPLKVLKLIVGPAVGVGGSGGMGGSGCTMGYSFHCSSDSDQDHTYPGCAGGCGSRITQPGGYHQTTSLPSGGIGLSGTSIQPSVPSVYG